MVKFRQLEGAGLFFSRVNKRWNLYYISQQKNSISRFKQEGMLSKAKRAKFCANLQLRDLIENNGRKTDERATGRTN